MREFLFSFVIPGWNVEQYLAEAVESVIAQTVGFKENIQIVLVNDGSTDGTGAICEAYRNRYPDNIIYINKPNGGVSSARNAGMKEATGRYISFLDADDKWDLEVCEAARDFFEDHPHVGIVCFPIQFFDRRTGGHWLNYKFKRTKVANIFTEQDYALLAVFPCFIKNKIVKQAEPFEERLSIAEDLQWIIKLLLEEQDFGVINTPCYRYRKRLEQNSALDTTRFNLSYYLDTPQLCHLEIFRFAKEKYGEIPPWGQYSVMLDLTWRFKEEDNGFLSPDQKEEYRSLLQSCLAQIDDRIILTVRNLWAEERLCALALKYAISYEHVKKWVKLYGETLCFCRPETLPLPLTQRPTLRVEFIDIIGERLLLRGSCPVLSPSESMNLILLVERPDGEIQQYPCALFRRPDRKKRSFFEGDLWALESFEQTLPLVDGGKVRAVANIDGKHCELRWSHERLSPFVRGNADSFLARAEYIVGNLSDNGGISLERSNPVRVCRRELAFFRQTVGKVGLRTAVLVACARLAGRLLRKVSRKPIWLISDRVAFAGDNGEALFEYLMANPDVRQGVRPFFLLTHRSADWKRLKSIGSTVPYPSLLHKILFLASDKVVSSSADDMVINPFGGGDWQYRDLYNFDFVFLQHGVTLHDQSRWLNKANKNIALFVTAARRERDSIVEGDYGYTPKQVALTGFPRHDKLLRKATREKPQRLVAVMPTWRENLVVARDPKTGLSLPNPAFEASVYFQFWNALINYPRLLEALRGHGYRLRFVIHPQSTHESGKFQAPEPVEVPPRCDYPQTFCESGLLVTDYSSVAFDFVLLKKPLIYAQFDRESFYSGHIYEKGYFDYERDGFGPVCGDLESTVDAVVHYLENGCGMESMYKERVDAFFGKQPENRCQAVLDAINRLGRRPN